MSTRTGTHGDHGHLVECPWNIFRCLAENLVFILPDNFLANVRLDHPDRAGRFSKKLYTIMRTLKAFFRFRFKPANAPDRIAALEVAAEFFRDTQMPVVPVKLQTQFGQHPLRCIRAGYVPMRLHEPKLDTGIRVDPGRYKSHIHDNLSGRFADLLQELEFRILNKLKLAALDVPEREASLRVLQNEKHVLLPSAGGCLSVEEANTGIALYLQQASGHLKDLISTCGTKATLRV